MADSKQLTNDEIKDRVLKLQRQIVSDVDADAVSDWLLPEKIMTVEQWQTIRASNTTRTSRCRALLLDLFSNSHPKTFLVLLDALEKEAHHIWESIVSQSPSASEGMNVPMWSPSKDQNQFDFGEKIQQLLCQQRNIEALCSDLSKQLEEEKERHRQEKENMDRAWKAEKNQLLQKQNQLERRISELEDLLQISKRKKSDVKEDEPSTSLDKTESEIRPILGIQPSEELQPCDTSSTCMRKAKEFFLKKENAETPSTQPKIKLSPRVPEENPPKICERRNGHQSPQQPSSLQPQRDPTSPQTPSGETVSTAVCETIRTKAAAEQHKAITGMTILDKELFIVSRMSSEVEVYDSNKLSFCRRWEVVELVAPVDIGSCKRRKCLYILHEKGSGQTTQIVGVDRDGVVSKRWPTGQEYGYSISVTYESTIVISVFQKNKLIEYSSDGQSLREVTMTVESGLVHPSHALKLTNGQFLVSHGTRNDPLHRVCLVDSDGKVKKFSSGKNGSVGNGMKRPVYLAVDGGGSWMVVDQWNSRVLLLDSNLKYVKEVLSKEGHGLRRPSRILLDESKGRLLVVDNEWDTTNLILIDGRILVFNHNS